MSSLLASPRRRRRLAWTGSLVAVVAGAAWLTVELDQRAQGDKPSSAQPVPEQVAEPAPAAEKPIVVTPAVRREVGSTVAAFVRTAVVRRDLGSAWELASPLMRAGVTRGDWNRGDLPVFPYPAAKLQDSSWRLTYVDGQHLGVDVTMFPKPRSGGLRLVYTARLSPSETAGDRRWLVDWWYPNVTLGSEEAPTNGKGKAARDEPVLTYGKARLSGRWLLVPVALFSLLLLVPAVMIARGARARRRADRLYRAAARR